MADREGFGQELSGHIGRAQGSHDWPGREFGIRKPYPNEVALSWDEVHHALKGLTQMNEWKPIETAPYDELLDLWRDGERLVNARKVKLSDGNVFFEQVVPFGYSCIRDATHWRLVPDGPECSNPGRNMADQWSDIRQMEIAT